MNHDSWCTYGFNALYQGTNVILTASHCTDETYALDDPPSVFYQNKIRSNDSIGKEWKDPPAFSGNHRNSDAVMIKYASGVSFNRGFIARTTSRSQTWGTNGSRLINASNRNFHITNIVTYPAVGQLVHKMGKTTGWTAGSVTETCRDLLAIDDIWRDCTDRARYYSDSGDSGAPVFILPASGTNVILVGIHWGNAPTLQVSNFSPLGGVFEDFGTMEVKVPMPPPPLVASFDGPRVVGPGDVCTYTGHASGGTPPYSYAWSGLLSGTGQQITGAINQSGGLVLTVTDSNDQQVVASDGIVVNQTAPNCGGS